VLVVALAVGGAVGLAGRDRRDTVRTDRFGSPTVAGEELGTTAPVTDTPAAHECDGASGSDIDVVREPNWRRYAAYLPWTDRDGCLVRIDVLAERPGPEHCGWERARVLIMGQPLGSRYSGPANDVEFVRDPDGVFDLSALTAGFVPGAVLPAAAVDSGYRRGTRQLWHVPGDPSAIWLRSPEGVERWPVGDAPLCS